MIDLAMPRFQWGQRVKALLDLVNDGSYPDVEPEAMLAMSGTVGQVVQIGTHTETNTHIYIVEFSEKRVVGCLEHEIGPVC